MATSLLIPVPEAEDLVASARGGPGTPAHITLAFPFVDLDALTQEVLSELRSRFGAARAFDYRLVRTTRFLDVLFLDPEPADPFRSLIRGLGADGPGGEGPPYPFGVTDILPHVTVMRSEEPEALSRAEAALAAALPVACRATEAWAVTGDANGPWRILSRFPLAEA